MRSSWKSKVLMSAAAVVLVTTFILAGTLSKYITTVSSVGGISGAFFNFNENGTQTWSADLVALGATPDIREERYRGEGDDMYETLDGGRMLAPGQSGSFRAAVSFVATVDSVAVADATVFEGTGAFADFATSLDTVALRFIVSDEEIANPDFTVEYDAAAAPYGYVNASGFESLIESVMESRFGEGGYYQAQEPPVRVSDVVCVYWEWLDLDTPEANEADTALGYKIYEAGESELTLTLSVTVEQVELD